MKRITALLLLLLTTPVFAQPTKGVTQVDEWAAITATSVREGATVDISDAYDAILYVDLAATSETAHEGTMIRVQISPTTSGDETWTDLGGPIIFGVGTAAAEAVSGTESAGQTVIEVASTTGYTVDLNVNRWVFFLNGTVANSELGYMTAFSANTSITVADGITNAQTSSTIYNTARRYAVPLPLSANRVRVIYDNNYDADGTASQVHSHAYIVETTAL